MWKPSVSHCATLLLASVFFFLLLLLFVSLPVFIKLVEFLAASHVLRSAVFIVVPISCLETEHEYDMWRGGEHLMTQSKRPTLLCEVCGGEPQLQSLRSETTKDTWIVTLSITSHGAKVRPKYPGYGSWHCDVILSDILPSGDQMASVAAEGRLHEPVGSLNC